MQHLLIQKDSVLQAKENSLYSVRFLHQNKLGSAVSAVLQRLFGRMYEPASCGGIITFGWRSCSEI